MSKTFFIADLHLGHKRALEFDFSWFNTIEDHDNHIIEQWNKVVTPKDKVWILGDISFHNAEKTIEIFNSLNGTKRLVVGNHDKKLLKNKDVRALFAEIVDYKELKFEDGTGIVLSHNPIPFYSHSNHGWYHLYGHLHNDCTYKELEKLKESMLINHKQELKMYNVGCMTYEIFYTPRTLDEIIDRYNEHKAERKKDLQGNKEIYGIADILASILYFFKDLTLEEVLEKIGTKDIEFWIKMGEFCSYQDRPQIISEWNEQYEFGSATYDDIFKALICLHRPEEEVIPIYNKLIGLYSDLITYENPKAKYYAISDIHGHLDILNDTVKNISLGINDKLIFLGDYIDGGPHSRQTLEYLYKLQERFPYNVVVLKGNHEELFLQWLEEDIEIAFLQEDKGLNTIKTFLKDNQLEIITKYLK
ncbi:MAG: metallophosphoesterase, partial [Eubacterium sp.]|nr:metallophosphoesterase [Eubacterium sp.]